MFKTVSFVLYVHAHRPGAVIASDEPPVVILLARAERV